MINYIERIVSAVIVWTLCFAATLLVIPVVTVLLIAFGTGRNTTHLEGVATAYLHTVMSPFPASPYWLTVLATGVVVATIVPWRRHRLRIRESAGLESVREESRMPAYEPDAAEVNCNRARPDSIIGGKHPSERGDAP